MNLKSEKFLTFETGGYVTTKNIKKNIYWHENQNNKKRSDMKKKVVNSMQMFVFSLKHLFAEINKIEEVHNPTDFDQSFTVDRINRIGEVAILWKCNFKCEILTWLNYTS